MNYKLLFGILIIGLLAVGSVSAYYCIYQEDNDGVREFKNNLNIISAKKDMADGLTLEQINIKLIYFGPCR